MNVDSAVEITRQAVIISLVIGAPVMLVALLVGLVISLFQAVTQLQDQTLSFVPKILAMIATVLVLLPWLFGQMVDYTYELWQNIPLNL